MAMPRPGGKALDIAKATIPGLPKSVQGDTSGNVPQGTYEETIISINENRGKLPVKPKNKGEASSLRKWDFRTAGYA